jgi:hypothetical protein
MIGKTLRRSRNNSGAKRSEIVYKVVMKSDSMEDLKQVEKETMCYVGNECSWQMEQNIQR